VASEDEASNAASILGQDRIQAVIAKGVKGEGKGDDDVCILINYLQAMF
jgi:hypothetical protein